MASATAQLNLPAPPYRQGQHDQQEQGGYAGAAFGIATCLALANLTLEPILPYGAPNIAKLIVVSFVARGAFEMRKQLARAAFETLKQLYRVSN